MQWNWVYLVQRAINELWHIIHLALFFRTDTDFHHFLIYKIFLQFYSIMTVVDMIFIHFYQSSLITSSCLSLKSSTWDSVDERCDAILQRNRWNKSFKTNYKIESQLQSKLTEEIRVEDEDIFRIQHHEKFI